MKARNLYYLFLAAVIAIGFTMAGCSKKGDLLQQISGKWQDNENKGTVEIQLAGDKKSMTVNGQTYPVNVEAVEMMNYVVNLKVQNGDTKPELWTLRQMWDESGSSFKLAFNHSGKKEILVSKQES